MAPVKRVDPEAIRQDAASGLDSSRDCSEAGCARSTVSYYLQGKEIPCAAKAANGAGKAPTTELASLKALADAEWERLPVVERVRLLLARGFVGGR